MARNKSKQKDTSSLLAIFPISPSFTGKQEFADLIAPLYRAPKSSSVQFSLHFPPPHFIKTTPAEVILRLSSHTLLLTTPFLKNSPSVCFSWQLLFPGFSSMPLVTLSQCHVQIPLLLLVCRSPYLAFSSHLRLLW